MQTPFEGRKRSPIFCIFIHNQSQRELHLGSESYSLLPSSISCSLFFSRILGRNYPQKRFQLHVVQAYPIWYKTTLSRPLLLPVLYLLQMYPSYLPGLFRIRKPHHIWFKLHAVMFSPGSLPETMLLCQQL